MRVLKMKFADWSWPALDINDDLNDGRSEEYDAEIYYGIHATNWLTIRPNVQYVPSCWCI